MKAIMPVAGLGSRFATVGITKPKPLIEIGSKKMVEWAADSIPFVDDENFVFIVRKAHVDRYGIDDELRQLFTEKVGIVTIDYLTEGPACTAALAEEFVSMSESVIITDSDHYFQSAGYERVLIGQTEGVDIQGAIPVHRTRNDGLSYSAVDDEMTITQVAEKERISQYANIGAYYFDEFGRFKWALDRAKNKGQTVNDEYYVAPLYNELIERGHQVVARECEAAWGLGTPDAVHIFEEKFLGSGDSG